MKELNPRLTPPNKNSDGNVWYSWYEELESEFGRQDAARAFTTRWGIVKPDAGNDHNLRERMAEKGIPIEANGIFGSIEDTAKSFTGGITSFFKMGATASIVLAGISLMVMLVIIYRLSKPEAVGTVIKYAK